jgi:ATP-binding cassette, subfamily F, member 3
MITINKLNLSFGDQPLFNDVSFNVNAKERIGLVGRNGSGKTTLFNILCNKISAGNGVLGLPKNYKIGIVEQHLSFSSYTVIDEACLGLPVGHEDDVWKAEKILYGLGFSEDDLYKDPKLFSGGYQVRLNLAKVLVSEPNLLLLDEPTNYLDIISIRWMERFLISWPNEMIIITHDRSFMDSVSTHTMIIHRQKVKKIEGDTSKLYEQIAIEEETHERTRVKDEKQRKEMETFINRFKSKATLAGMAQSRIKALNRMTKLEKLERISSLEFSFNEADFVAKNIMSVENISFAYPEKETLINNFSLTISKNDRICIIGKNGKGKTTLLKLLSGELTPIRGEVSYHPGVKAGVFGQTNIERLNHANTIESELMSSSNETNPKVIRSVCGAMMFSGDLAKKSIKVLSGGEKSRVLLGKILLAPSNFLLLDEPTNHLDMDSCDSLIEAINNFASAVVVVTHNELFLNNIANRLIVFNEDGIELFEGTYAEFLDDVGWQNEVGVSKKKQAKAEAKEKENNKDKQKEFDKEKNAEIKAIKNEIATIEKRIEILEKEIQENNVKIAQASIANDGTLIAQLSKENHEFQSKLDKQYALLEIEIEKI